MWNLFSKKTFLPEKPKLELLYGNCIECQSCGGIASIIGPPPLTITKCGNCGEGIFVPYLIKEFWLYRPLGGGGMGSVYKAFHEKNINTEYAVKILPRKEKENPRLIEALLREAEIGKTFDRHPHLVFVSDYGKYADEYFCSMEFCPGKRLDQLIDEPEPIPSKFILLWGLQILSAEQKMFDAGYLFRDLKPQNIIINAGGNVKLIDYGLCEETDKKPDKDKMHVEGSPMYMPPERIVGMAENMSSEIYSLGMVMFHAFAKRTYYAATGINTESEIYDLAHKHIAGIRFASVLPKMPVGIPSQISSLLDKMIARNPSSRFQTYKEAAQQMRDIYNKL
jgi:serine/threonine-protein kinase